MYTLLSLIRIINTVLLYSTGNPAQCNVAAWMGEEFEREWRHVYVWLSPFAVLWNYHNIVSWVESNIKLKVKKYLRKRVWVYPASPGQYIFTYTLHFGHCCCSLFFFIMMMNFHHAASQMKQHWKILKEDLKRAKYNLIPVVLLCTSQTQNRAGHFLLIITPSLSSPCLGRVIKVGLRVECRNRSANEEKVFKLGSCSVTQAPLKMVTPWDHLSSYSLVWMNFNAAVFWS